MKILKNTQKWQFAHVGSFELDGCYNTGIRKEPVHFLLKESFCRDAIK